MRQDDSGVGAGSVILSFFIGGMIGAGIGLLLAPRTGREMRAQISEFADEVRGRAEGYYDTVKVRAGDYYGEVRQSVTNALEKGKGMLEEKKSAITSAVQAGIDAYEKETGKGGEA